MAKDFKDTLNLPKTDFPMRAGLVAREPARVRHWEETGLYAAIQKRREGRPAFVLHDGPPFTNGDVHIGTALNKTLKDIILRYKSMRGFRTPYVPGWDCHGLPIEQKVTRELQQRNEQVDTAQLRARCGEFSESWIGRQRAQFQRLGVLADWAHEYKTKEPGYEADILRTFAAFIDKGLVYRSKKPVYWSIPFETALAEAEIEYKDHVSPSIWVKFPVPPAECARIGIDAAKKVSVVIWTTTPWTLPANLAIAVHPDVAYVAVELGGGSFGGVYIVARPLLDRFCSEIGYGAGADAPAPAVLREFAGSDLVGLKPRHPFIDRESPVLPAEYVTTDSGTGCVHTAPGHGHEDYQTGIRHGLEIYCPVDGNGRFVDDGRVPADLVGLSTLETVEEIAKKRTSQANIGVLRKLESAGALLAHQRFSHSYPHCWRSKTPIIFLAVDQWFVSLDKGGIRGQALDAIGRVNWIPAWGGNRIRGAVESRPDWCISRQRSWGVPIPAFYDADRNAWLDAGVVRAIADKVARHGTNLWYEQTPEQILEGIELPRDWPDPAALTCGRDTLDVWIDSGSSHAAVLRNPAAEGLHWPADLYLEGSDQHRGWFQSSLWTGIIAAGGPPYRTVLTHGFIVGKDGKKISKSGQYEKPPTSDNYIAQYGADVIRLWVASQDFSEDITVSDLGPDLKNPASILNVVSESYRLFRNTLRYQISNLHDFDPAHDAVPLEKMDVIDRWALHHTARLLRTCTAAYDACEFHRVIQQCNPFCAVTLSAVYHDILKDRLYTHAANSPLRRSSQTALHHIFHTLVRMLAPVLVFTADEAWSFATAGREYTDGSVHLQDWPESPAGWEDAALEAEVAELLQLRTQVNEVLERLRQAGTIGKSLDAAITLRAASVPAVEKHASFLPELFIVSQVALAPAGGGLPLIEAQQCRDLGLVRCPRCWRWVPAAAPGGEVCPRCATAVPR